jgi:hypothetical protein
MALIAKLVLVVTIAASSGLTAVLHTCVMERMDCCGHSPSAGHCDCGPPGVPPSGPSISADFTCDANTIVGGLTIKSGEAQKDKRSVPTRVAFATTTTSLYGSLSRTSGSSHTLLSVAAALPPPSVEKYVLNSSLLI